MNWVLVVVLAGSPIQTDMKFKSLDDCMAIESQMAVEYVRRTQMQQEALKLGEAWRAQNRERTPWGACIPAR